MCRLPTNLNTAVHFKRSNDEKASMQTKAVQLKRLSGDLFIFGAAQSHAYIFQFPMDIDGVFVAI